MTAAVALPGFLNSLGPLLTRHGYVAVGGLILLEDFGVPVPGETVLIAAALYAGAGQLNIVAVALVAFAAAVLGDNLGYGIGRLGGRPLLERFGRYVFLTPERLATAERFFDHQGAKIIVVARFIEGLRQANGLIAGAGAMIWRRFLACNVLGAALWVACWTTVGELAGGHIDTIYRDLTDYFPVLAVVLAGAIVALALGRRGRRRKAASAAGEGEPSTEASSNEASSTAG